MVVRPSRYDSGTIAFILACIAGCFVFLLFAFGWWVERGAPMPGEPALQNVLEDSPQGALVFIPLMAIGLLGNVMSVGLGLAALFRRNANKSLALLAVFVGSTVLTVALIDWILPTFVYCC
jgi:hypothetical protein